MSTFTKEQLIEKLQHRISVASGFPESEKAQMDLELARIALASLEAEPAIHRWRRVTAEPYGPYPWHYGNFICFSKPVDGIEDEYYYAAPPAPVSVPDGYRLQPISEYDAMCAAMLQGADRPQNEPQNIPENIPATQFKPVADLYGLTSPTGGETSFTFDAVEARDFIDGGWSCQEYVELERFQEAITNHTEDKLAMVDHSGDSNNMVESVTTACELRDAVDAIRNSGIAIDGEKILAERDALNSPVIPDGWVACSERMPEIEVYVLALHVEGYCEVVSVHLGMQLKNIYQELAYERSEYWWVRDSLEYAEPDGSFTHWMPLPAAPQQEVK